MKAICVMVGVLVAGMIVFGVAPAGEQPAQPDLSNLEPGERMLVQLVLQMRENRVHEAIATLKKILSVIPPEQKVDAAWYEHLLASQYFFLGEFKDALEHETKAYRVFLEELGENDERTVGSREGLGEALSGMGRFSAAEPHLKRALEFDSKQKGDPSEEAADAHLKLAKLYRDWGRYGKSLEHAKLGEAAYLAKFGEKDLASALAMQLVGLSLFRLGNSEEARQKFEQVLQIYRDLGFETAPVYATCLNSFALILRDLGDLSRALELAEKSLQLSKQAGPQERDNTLRAHNTLGMIYEALGERDRAADAYLNALPTEEESQANAALHASYVYSNLALFCQSSNRMQDAEAWFRKALAADLKIHDTKSQAYGDDLHNYAGFLLQKGRHEEAVKMFKDALKTYADALGEQHPRTAMTHLMLGRAYEYGNRLQEAQEAYEVAAKGVRQSLGPKHPSLGMALALQAKAAACVGKSAEAADFFDQARRVYQTYVSQELLALPERTQLNFLAADDQKVLQLALSLPLQKGVTDGAKARSADWIVNGKATCYRAIARRSRLLRQDRNSDSFRLFQELQEKRQELARLSVEVPRPEETETHGAQVRQCSERVDELIRELGRRERSVAAEDSWIGLAEVQQALGEDTVLVELARVRVEAFRGGPPVAEEHYVAWVIPSATVGRVEVIDLGKVDAIEAALLTIRQGLAASGGRAGTIENRKEDVAAKELRPALEDLSRLILHPLLPSLDKPRNWLLSPDSSLWLVPWEALTTRDGKYAVENHRISYLLSSRDLVSASRLASAAGKGAFIFAAPDFELDPDRVAAGAERLRQRNKYAIRGAAERSRNLISRRWEPLAGAAEVVTKITPAVKLVTQSEPIVYRGDEALEAAFRSLTHPQVVIFETHAFFLDDERVGDAAGLACTQRELFLANPLLRCGLVLAGANQRQKRSDSKADDGVLAGVKTEKRPDAKTDDGILTGLEIVDTDLSGCELVVLSACDTGLGEVVTGQGVAGLRQAFHLAGARRVIASLWKVDDAETAEIMRMFWTHRAGGSSCDEALYQAKLDWIAARRKAGIEPHPYFWAAFTISGPCDKPASAE